MRTSGLHAGRVDKALPEAELAAKLNARDPAVAATSNEVRSEVRQVTSGTSSCGSGLIRLDAFGCHNNGLSLISRTALRQALELPSSIQTGRAVKPLP